MDISIENPKFQFHKVQLKDRNEFPNAFHEVSFNSIRYN